MITKKFEKMEELMEDWNLLYDLQNKVNLQKTKILIRLDMQVIKDEYMELVLDLGLGEEI